MNTCDKCLHDCVCQKQEIYGGICTDFAEKPRFKPGDKVWAIVRGEWGAAINVAAFKFLAEAAGVVFMANGFCLNDPVNVVVAKLVNKSRLDIDETFVVFSTDCYPSKEKATAALRREVELDEQPE